MTSTEAHPLSPSTVLVADLLSASENVHRALPLSVRS